ncbi:hypothetical protein [Bifidobacterium asteroides]|uniref:Colicin transporter n=1 Tax=Bifidobacterium asteroides TaxID=1684 RepID=A0A2N3RCB6_9BIFI|nr:hypothetical protein [Bifidobacterium asteroides]PKV10117.1 hypothetical protein CQR44_0387 [Bifidobacterium asteroides]
MSNKDQQSEVDEAGKEAGLEQAPPVVVPEDGDAASGKRHPKWLVPVIVAVVAVMVVVAGLLGWRVVESRRHESALDSCNRVTKTLQEKTGSAMMASYREASRVKVDQVKNAKTVANMSRSVKTAGGLEPPSFQCKASMSADDLNAQANKAKELDGEYAAVSKSAKAVIASRDAKTLEDAKAALNAKRDEASKLLGDSDGKVADSAVRDNLQKVIDQVGQIKADTAKAYRDAVNALQSAIDQVNASMQAKSQADQLAAQQAASSNNSGRSGYTPTYRPSTNRGGSGGGYAPAPAPAAPQDGNPSAGFDWKKWLQSQKPIGNHGCNPDGSCGIG